MTMSGYEAACLMAVITREGVISIPEAAVIKPIGRSVLDTPPSRGMTVFTERKRGSFRR